MSVSEKIPEEIQLELLAPWYSENKRDTYGLRSLRRELTVQ